MSGAWATPGVLGRFSQLAEELGYHSLWSFQRLLVPAEGHADPVYRSVLDPLTALAFAAARTERIRLGVALVNLPFISPTQLAKQASTLDVLSGGRFDLGLGIGWSAQEFAATGARTERRGARTVEFVEVLRRFWGEEVAEFSGEFYTVPPSRMAPKPVQPGGPPVILGGASPRALARAGWLADGWMSRSATNLDGIGEQIAAVRAAAKEAGRDPARLRIITRGVVRPDPRGVGVVGPDGRRLRLSGSFEQIREDVAWLGGQGVTELFYDLNWDPRIGHPEADPAQAAARAEEILRALAPR